MKKKFDDQGVIYGVWFVCYSGAEKEKRIKKACEIMRR